MRITIKQLKRIIKEEVQKRFNNLNEVYDECPCGIDRTMCDYHKGSSQPTDDQVWESWMKHSRGVAPDETPLEEYDRVVSAVAKDLGCDEETIYDVASELGYSSSMDAMRDMTNPRNTK